MTLTAENIGAVQQLLHEDHRGGIRALDRMFRNGSLPDPPLEGQYQGRLLALTIAPVLTPLAERLAAAWMPWQGKTFHGSTASGANVFTRDALPLAHVFWPTYRRYRADGPRTYQAFAFRTYPGPGLLDPDRPVLKIDYDLPENPSLSVRRVLDELVQIDDQLYLGKAHLRWWWGRWQTVAFFSLTPEVSHAAKPNADVRPA